METPDRHAVAEITDPMIKDPMDKEKKSNRTSLRVNRSVGAAQGHPLRLLKSIVLTLDWEITDQVMARFLNQVGKLKIDCGTDRSALLMLKILDSVGRYIRGYKEKADPYAMTALMSTYAGLEKMVVSGQLPLEEKEKILSGAVNRFKKLKARAALQTAGRAGIKEKAVHGKADPADPGRKESTPATEQEPVGDPVLNAIAEIRDLVHAEVKMIRRALSKIDGIVKSPKITMKGMKNTKGY